MKLYGLIGFPLAHSFSRQYFTEKFAREQLDDCVFQAFPIESIHDLPSILKANPSLKGLSVTVPYKVQVLQYVTTLSEQVKDIGATNSIKISGNNLIAFNTDAIGFERSFKELLKPYHAKALILGTGGASKAVQFTLNKLGIQFLLVSRSKILEDKWISYKDVGQSVLEEYTVVINSTPSGMWPNTQECPAIPYNFLTPRHYVFDLIYKPEKTLFLRHAEAQGAVIKNGYDMLIFQADESWKIWNTSVENLQIS